MQPLCQYPITAEAVNPYIGRPVVAFCRYGDLHHGIIDRIHDGSLVMRPLDGVSPATILQYKAKMKRALRQSTKKPKQKTHGFENRIAEIKAWGAGHPYGWGHGNLGFGLGWWWIFPLFWLTALFAFPFFI